MDNIPLIFCTCCYIITITPPEVWHPMDDPDSDIPPSMITICEIIPLQTCDVEM